MGRTMMLLALAFAISFSFVPNVAAAEDFSCDINGLFGIHWGDTRAELLELFQANLKRATYSDVAGYQRFAIKRDDRELRYTVDDAEFLGLNFDLLIFTDEEKVTKVVGSCKGIDERDYDRLKDYIVAKLGEPRRTRSSDSWLFKVFSSRLQCSWRAGRNAMGVTFSDTIFGDTIRIRATGVEKLN